jgi:hypothetical protein
MRIILTMTHSTPSPPICRAATARVLCYAFMLRADSCVHLKHQHVSFTVQGLPLQLHVKTSGRDISTTVHRPGHDEVYQLLLDWVRMCQAPGQASLWAVPDRQHDTFTLTCINRWFQVSCDILGLRPPHGFKCPVTSWASVPPKVRSGWDIHIALAATLPHFPSTPAFPPWLVLGCGIIWVVSKYTWMSPSGRLLTPSSSSSTSPSQPSPRSAISSQHSVHKLRGYLAHIAVFCSALLDWSFALLSPQPPQQIWPDYYRNPCICNRWPCSSARVSGDRVPPTHRSTDPLTAALAARCLAHLACRSYLLCSSARGRPPTIAFRDL